MRNAFAMGNIAYSDLRLPDGCMGVIPRDIGPRDSRWTLPLLRQTPLSMIQYDGKQAAPAQREVSAALSTNGSRPCAGTSSVDNAATRAWAPSSPCRKNGPTSLSHSSTAFNGGTLDEPS